MAHAIPIYELQIHSLSKEIEKKTPLQDISPFEGIGGPGKD